MRGKPAAAAPSFGERFRLPGAAAISSVFSCFSPSKSSKSRSVLSRGRLPAAHILTFSSAERILQRKSDLPSSIFSCFSTAKSSKQPFHPVTRAAACGPRAASGDHAGLQANRPRRFPHPVLRLLLRPRDTAGGISPRLKHETKRSKNPPDASRIRACGCRFALVTQSEVFRQPKHETKQPLPDASPPCDTTGGVLSAVPQQKHSPLPPTILPHTYKKVAQRPSALRPVPDSLRHPTILLHGKMEKRKFCSENLVYIIN